MKESKLYIRNPRGYMQAGSAIIDWILLPCIATSIALWPTLFSGLTKLQFDAGDSLFNLYILEHCFQHFSSGDIFYPDRFWSPDFFWPIKEVLTWSDHLLGPSILYGCLRLLLNKYESYAGWLFATLCLNYISIRICLKQVSPSTPEIFISIASIATSFSPAIIGQLGHPQLLSMYMIGPIITQCHRLIHADTKTFAIADWLAFGSLLLCNGFFNIYLFVYSCYGALFCCIIHICRRVKSHDWGVSLGTNLLLWMGAFFCSTTLNFIIYTPYLRALKTFGSRSIDEIITNLPKPASWFYGTSDLLIPAPISEIAASSGLVFGVEQRLFPGWTFCILIVAAVLTTISKRNSRDNGLHAWLVVFGLMTMCSINIHNLSLWPFISKFLPGASSLRASSRISMIIIMFGAPAISLAASYWKLPSDKRLYFVINYILLLGGLMGTAMKNPPSFSLASWKQELQNITNALNRDTCDVFWYEWKDQPPEYSHVIAMHSAQITGIPTLNGYSGQFPKEGWPFARSSGDLAYDWTRNSHPEEHHKIKRRRKVSELCIVFSDEKNAGRTRHFNPYLPRPVITIDQPEQVVYSNSIGEIGSKGDELFIRVPEQHSNAKWTLLYQDGKSIPANRANYSITNITLTREEDITVAEVTDRHITGKIEYIWKINPRTGAFLDQTVIER